MLTVFFSFLHCCSFSFGDNFSKGKVALKKGSYFMFLKAYETESCRTWLGQAKVFQVSVWSMMLYIFYKKQNQTKQSKPPPPNFCGCVNIKLIMTFIGTIHFSLEYSLPTLLNKVRIRNTFSQDMQCSELYLGRHNTPNKSR